ncbi:Enoyl-CoA hydratase [hydrothermal vent metagenome]|uniref:Enoyl-CoA hydratase n=1 Tax=hydrothermal vent metagenome TaxID=652676 RepID=A0A3B0RI48_9ZZZZ
MKQAVRIENDGGVRSLVLCRGDEYNTITPQFRDEFGAALDEADTDPTVRVVLIRAEGPAFCAGFGLDWSTLAQATEESGPERAWDSVADMAMIGSFADTWAKLFELSKPTIAAVHGWCIAGGTDMILNADMIIAADTARFGYPPARVWGTPEAPWMWVARLGLERAKRYLLTGDEMTGAEAAEIGFVLEAVPEDDLLETATALAQRMALLPLNQLQMLKLLCNDVARDMYRPERSRLLGTLFDGVARHTQEGLDFVSRAQEVGWRQVVRERDEPFGDYGSRPNDTGT